MRLVRREAPPSVLLSKSRRADISPARGEIGHVTAFAFACTDDKKRESGAACDLPTRGGDVRPSTLAQEDREGRLARTYP
jgi:hypothetical protein